MELEISNEFGAKLPDYRVILMEGDVTVSPTGDEQKKSMDALAEEISSKLAVNEINTIPAIKATRNAYKVCGKDPNRYRPSQEQLMRRIVRGLGLYNVNSLVDAGNELSLTTGCSVGCFDAAKIEGDTLTIGIGSAGEPYEGIGRGAINVEGLPIVRDSKGGIGTPTSDNERTKITPDTRHLVMTIHLFDNAINAESVINKAKELFSKYADAKNWNVKVFAVS